MIFYTVPYKYKDIGGGLNEHIALAPDNAWICVRDGDTMFLDHQWGLKIERIKDEAERRGYGLVGCKTNRIGSTWCKHLHAESMFTVKDLDQHIEVSHRLWSQHEQSIVETKGMIAGYFMLFKKSVWEENHFEANHIAFDKLFSDRCRDNGVRIGIANGLYVFHLYRWGKENPEKSINHLM